MSCSIFFCYVSHTNSIVIYPLDHLVWDVVAKWGPASKKQNKKGTTVKERNKTKQQKKKEKEKGKIDRGSSQQPGRNLFVGPGRSLSSSCFHSPIFSDWRILEAWRRAQFFFFFVLCLFDSFPFLILVVASWWIICFSYPQKRFPEVKVVPNNHIRVVNTEPGTTALFFFCGIQATSNAIWMPFRQCWEKNNRSRWSLMRVCVCLRARQTQPRKVP